MKPTKSTLRREFSQETLASFTLTSTLCGPDIAWALCHRVSSLIYDPFSHCQSYIARPLFQDRWVIGKGTLRNCMFSTWAAAALNHWGHAWAAPRTWLKRAWHSAVTNEWALGDDPSSSERQRELWRTNWGIQGHAHTDPICSTIVRWVTFPETERILPPTAHPAGTPASSGQLPSAGLGWAAPAMWSNLSKDMGAVPSV